jgi:DNA-binding transcriptional LysR family regulator
VANLIRRDLAPIRWAVCASPGYLKAFAAPDDADDLRRHNCIFYASAAVRGDVWTLSCKGETRLVTVSGNFRANNSEAVRDAAVRGVGLALLPTFAMWQDLKSGALVRVLPDWTPHGTFGNSLTAYYIADRQLAPRSGHWSTSWPNVSGALPPGTAVSRWVLPKNRAEGGSLALKRRNRGRTG